MIQELFTLNKEYMVDINKEWISTIAEFRILLRRDKGSKGDVDGRKKLHAQREFTYIYHYCDFKSQFREFAEMDRRNEALRNAGLEDKDINQGLKDAIERYRTFQNTRGLRVIADAYLGIDKLSAYFRDVDLDERDLNVRIVNDSKKLADNISKVASLLKGLSELEDLVKSELEEKGRIRGGAKRGGREDSKSSRGTIEIVE